MGQRSESRAGTQRGKTLFEIEFELLCTYNLTRHCDLFWPFLLTEILAHPIFTVPLILYFWTNTAIGGAKQNSANMKQRQNYFSKYIRPKVHIETGVTIAHYVLTPSPVESHTFSPNCFHFTAQKQIGFEKKYL